MARPDLQHLEARWRANPGDREYQTAALTAFRTVRVDAPLDLIVTSPDWRPFVRVAHDWFREPLARHGGYSTAELDALERDKKMLFPPTVREWWRIAGKHPCCGAWDGSWYGHFLRPDDPEIRPDNLPLAHLDLTVGIAFVVHRVQMDQADPEVFEHNDIADPKHWFIDKSMRTGGSVPQIIWQSMLSLICLFPEPPPMLGNDVFVLNRHHFIEYEYERAPPNGAVPFRDIDWEKLRRHFGLVRCPVSIHFNDVDYDGSTIVLGWGSLAVRTLEAAIAVNSYVGKAAEERGLRSPRDAWSKFPPQSGAR